MWWLIGIGSAALAIAVCAYAYVAWRVVSGAEIRSLEDDEYEEW